MKNGRDHQGTPDYVVRYAERILIGESFDLDSAASEWNAKAHTYFTEKDNGLTSPWYGSTWCNPPWDYIDPWVPKAIKEAREGVQSVLLLPTRSGKEWFQLLLESPFLSSVTWIQGPGRIKFDPPPGEEKGKGGFEWAALWLLHPTPSGSTAHFFVPKPEMETYGKAVDGE